MPGNEGIVIIVDHLERIIQGYKVSLWLYSIEQYKGQNFILEAPFKSVFLFNTVISKSLYVCHL